jgi:hypothetical protein
MIAFLGFSSAAGRSDEGGDLSFISGPIIDELVDRLIADDQQRVADWLMEDENFAGVSGKIIELSRSGKIFHSNISWMPTKDVEAVLVEAGVPASLLGGDDLDAVNDPLVRLLAEVSEKDGKNVSLYFDTFPQFRSSFDIYATTNSVFKALEMVGFPLSQDMKDSMAAAELNASRKKYLKLFDPTKVEAFCEELAQSGAGTGVSRIFSAGTAAGFFIAQREDYYGAIMRTYSEDQLAEQEAVNPYGMELLRFLNGPLDGIVSALQSDPDLSASLMMPKNSSLPSMFGGGKKRQRVMSDTCLLYSQAYLSEIGL